MDTRAASVLDPIVSARECAARRVAVSGALPDGASSATLGSNCEGCAFAATCVGRAFRAATDAERPLVGYRRAIGAGRTLYCAGARCSSVYVVESGFFKTVTLSEDGAAQVTGFQMSGDLLGMDGFGSGIHRSDAIALSRASVCVISRAHLFQASADNEALARLLFGVLSEEIASDHRGLLLFGSRSAEERVAAFVVDIAERLSARGYASSDIELWMTREDIGSFLGLELETISRVLGRLTRRGLLHVHRRHLHIRSVDALREAVAGQDVADEFRAQARQRRGTVALTSPGTAAGRARTGAVRRTSRRSR
jgi:CRP/FNR family transcriptional regulator